MTCVLRNNNRLTDKDHKMSTKNFMMSFSVLKRFLRNDIAKYNRKCVNKHLTRLNGCFCSTNFLPLTINSPHFVQKRYAQRSRSTTHRKARKVDDDDRETGLSDPEDSETDIESDSDNEISDFPPETDPSLPSKYTDTMVYVIRADQIVGKCLVKSASAATKLFYEGKLKLNNKTLMKKATKVRDNDIVDLVHEENDKTMTITRVKVLKLLDTKTKSGRPKTMVRVWKKQFTIDKAKTR